MAVFSQIRLVTFLIFGIILFSYFSSLSCKTFFEKLSYREKGIRSTKNCLFEIKYPRNICSRCFFITCAGTMKRAFNPSHHNVRKNREKSKEKILRQVEVQRNHLLKENVSSGSKRLSRFTIESGHMICHSMRSISHITYIIYSDLF